MFGRARGEDAVPADFPRELRRVVDGERAMLKEAMASAIDGLCLESLGPFIPATIRSTREVRECGPADP